MIEIIGGTILALLGHELGHVGATLACGLRVRGVVLNRQGFGVRREAGSPAQNCVIALAGPLASLMLLVLFRDVRWFALCNFIFCFVNLLPIRGSDGWKVVKWGGLRNKSALSSESKLQ